MAYPPAKPPVPTSPALGSYSPTRLLLGVVGGTSRGQRRWVTGLLVTLSKEPTRTMIVNLPALGRHPSKRPGSLRQCPASEQGVPKSAGKGAGAHVGEKWGCWQECWHRCWQGGPSGIQRQNSLQALVPALWPAPSSLPTPVPAPPPIHFGVPRFGGLDRQDLKDRREQSIIDLFFQPLSHILTPGRPRSSRSSFSDFFSSILGLKSQKDLAFPPNPP